MIDQARLKDLDNTRLSVGSHTDLSDGMCVMEAVSYVAGEPWSDHPKCVSPTIATFLRTWNDSLGDNDRERLLRPLIARVIGTAASPEIEERRGWVALDWMVRTMTPAWLELAGLKEHAGTLRELVEIVDEASFCAEQSKVYAARDAAWAAARDAAGDAAWDAAWAAAGDAAWAAARDAAWDAAGAAAGAAARDAARNAAGAAAGDAAGDAAWDAAWAAAGAAAGDAAGDALEPMVQLLQASALDLVERMIAISEVE